MSGPSSIDSLRRLSPVSDASAAAVFGVAGREELLAGVTHLPLGRGARRRPVTRRRRLVLAVGALAVVAIATAATWAAVRSGAARETTSVECLIGNSDAVIPSTTGNPVHDCTVDYKRELGTAPPRLVAYDNGLGGVTVIPHSQKPPAGWKRLVSGQDVDLIQLQDSLDDYINGLDSSCLGTEAATSLAASKLGQFGFTGWTIARRSPGPSSTNLPGSTTEAGGKKAAPTQSLSGTRMCVAGDIVDPATQSVTLIPMSVGTGPETTFERLADKLRPLTQSCESLPAAVASVRAAAGDLGLSESDRTYDLNAVTDNSMRCASIYETVGGTTFITVRGPGR
jgi:hypothetical protein